jgi:hypothetical protein
MLLLLVVRKPGKQTEKPGPATYIQARIRVIVAPNLLGVLAVRMKVGFTSHAHVGCH